MDSYTKNLIEKRALQLAKICEHVLLNEDDTCELAGTGFRSAYLILRKPKKYLENFRYGALMIDPYLLQESFWLHQEHIEGPSGLMPEEKMILQEHNEASSAWMKNNPAVIGIAREAHEYCRR
jgi:hypothetical protein